MHLFTTRRNFTFLLLFFCFCLQAAGQVVTTSPTFPTANEEVTLTFDVSEASDARAAGLLGKTSDIYLWAGAGTTETGNAFEYVPTGQTNWEQPFEPGRMTYLGDDRWQITMVPREYFNVPDDVTIRRLGLLLKNGNGTAQTEDLYVTIYPAELTAAFIAPTQELLFTQASTAIPVQAAASAQANLTLKLDNTIVATATNEEQLSYTLNTGTQAGKRRRVVLEAATATETASDTFYFIVEPAPVVAALPAGVQDGITYINAEEVVLTLFAPEKEFVYVIGEFNNWLPSEDYLMNRTPDGDQYWLHLTDLPAGEEVAFQYLVDGEIAVADPYAEKILDPIHDPYLTDANYPDLKPHPTRAEGIVSVLQTNQQEYNWQVENFERPDVERLVIYEMLVRDFVATRNYKTLADTLSYLKSLNINAIELMPVMEFSGNDSWGYNPTFFFAPDKAYGTEEDLKAFIDECHKAGIAVILDIVLNQADYENPYVRLYWDEAQNRPAANNPFFNQEATHPFSVFFDFNHESEATQEFVERVTRYWLEEYKIDGYRFDLSKGFTQNNTGNNVDAWSAYDASRVAIWKDIYDHIRGVNQSAYVILEHFAVNQEEKELAAYGMLFWGNLNHDYREAAKGNNANLEWISYQERGWEVPHVVGYIESHDEERLMYDLLQNGRSAGSYNIRNLTTALNRAKLAAAFSLTVPGPKMMWQFGELGYDVSIEENGRTGAKPIRWEYQDDPERQKLFNVYAELIKLKTTVPAFATDDFTLDLDDMVKRITLDGEDMTVFLIGNFDVQPLAPVANFPSAGTWYDYFTGEEVNVTNTAETIALQPGEFRLLTTEPLPAPPANLLPWQQVVLDAEEQLADARSLVVYPNPIEAATVIELNNSYRGAVSLQVVDVTGRILRTVKAQKGQQTLQQELNLQNLAGGLYYLQVEQGGQKSTRKLVKLRQ
ncbi:T9SS C-terminal target domain-containing protein [Pontibacter diazotrophicus]|uniref:T9SS C-terminal target domain-containing protein n=1 Tax=Pontibacter diazotrophicus TaxID=1400979 RepID=A0A3D8LHD2_9BACT|nr:alpha-amylase family glycosyl hydrolase [Pontibacter diazotrophicus]RDV16815.1 T9SS C-terminal target domain-containing protein [Pontibacter diazotrophicus]